MEPWNSVVCFSKIDGFENPPQKIDGFGRTRRTPSDDSTEKYALKSTPLEFKIWNSNLDYSLTYVSMYAEAHHTVPVCDLRISLLNLFMKHPFVKIVANNSRNEDL